MDATTDAEWLASQRAEALAECQRCGGRESADCSDDCRYWRLTASPAERLPLAQRYRLLKPKPWCGPVRLDVGTADVA